MLATSMRGLFTSGTLVDGEEVEVSMVGAPLPATLWVNPAAGDTVNLWISFDNGASWLEWEEGACTILTATSLNSGATNLKAQRTAGSGTTSTFGVS